MRKTKEPRRICDEALSTSEGGRHLLLTEASFRRHGGRFVIAGPDDEAAEVPDLAPYEPSLRVELGPLLGVEPRLIDVIARIADAMRARGVEILRFGEGEAFEGYIGGSEIRYVCDVACVRYESEVPVHA